LHKQRVAPTLTKANRSRGVENCIAYRYTASDTDTDTDADTFTIAVCNLLRFVCFFDEFTGECLKIDAGRYHVHPYAIVLLILKNHHL